MGAKQFTVGELVRTLSSYNPSKLVIVDGNTIEAVTKNKSDNSINLVLTTPKLKQK